MLLKNPGFTTLAIVTLAVGIGANTVIFCVAKSLMFPALPYPNAGGIVNLVQSHRENGGWAASIPDFLDWKEQNHAFAQLAVSSYGWATVSGGAEPEEVDTAYVSDEFFSLLGVAPLIGRTFLPEEYRPGAEHVMILGYGLWQRQFADRPDVLGHQLILASDHYTIVGVMPAGFEEPFFTKAFLPLSARKDSIPTDRRNRRSGVFARLKPGVTLPQAQHEMALIADRLAQAYPESNKDFTALVTPWRERMTSRFRVMIGLLLGAVTFLLLIGCANVANLLMARATTRLKEIAVRLAIGARRARLIRQLLTESLVLAALGGMAGVLLAFWSVPLLNNIYPLARPFSLDVGILSLTAGLVGITALLFGAIPALMLAKLELREVLKDKTGGEGGVRSHRLRNTLVVGEMFLSLVLLYGAALLIQSFIRLESLEKGFNPQNVLNVVVNLYKDRFPHGSQVVQFGGDVLVRLEHLPGSEASAVATPISLQTGPGSWGITRVGWQDQVGAAAPIIDPLAVSHDYFHVMEIPLLRGRAFTRPEAERGAPSVILSEKLAHRLWPGEDPIGKSLKLETAGSALPWLSVIGVAREARGHSFPSAGTEALGVYIPLGLMRLGDGRFSQAGGNRDGRFTSLRFYIRTAGDPKNRSGAIRSAVSEVDKLQPVFSMQTMEEKLYQEGSHRRTMAILVGVFAVVALLLATLGTYGVVACSTSERTSEIGIRIALGAQRKDVMALVLKQGVRALLIGLALGLAGAAALSGILESQLFGISAGDPLTLLGISLLLAGATLLACFIPARRATRVDPLVALKYE